MFKIAAYLSGVILVACIWAMFSPSTTEQQAKQWVAQQLYPAIQTVPPEAWAGQAELMMMQLPFSVQELQIWQDEQLQVNVHQAIESTVTMITYQQGAVRVRLAILPVYSSPWLKLGWAMSLLLVILPLLWLAWRREQLFSSLVGLIGHSTSIPKSEKQCFELLAEQRQVQLNQMQRLQETERVLLDDLHRLTVELANRSENEQKLLTDIQQLRTPWQQWQLWIKQLVQTGDPQQMAFVLPLIQQMASPPAHATLQHYPHASAWFAEQGQPLLMRLNRQALLVLSEDPSGLSYRLSLDALLSRLTFESLLQLVIPHHQGNELELRYQVDTDQALPLEICLKYQGEAFSERILQLLAGVPLVDCSLSELPARWLAWVVQHRGVQLEHQAVSGLGGKFILRLPAMIERQPVRRLFQSLCLVDSRDCRASVHRKTMQAVAEQVFRVRDLAELQDEIRLRLFDGIVLWFDQPVTDEQLNILAELAARYVVRVQCPFAAARELPNVVWSITPLFLQDMLNECPNTALQRLPLLVVDDNLINLNFVDAMLKTVGIPVDKANCGEEALQKARTCAYQVILMDIQLPDISGVEVTRQIRQLRHHQQTEIIAFTGHAMADEIASFRLAGMDDVLIKPLDTAKMAHLIQRLRPTTQAL